MTNAFGETTSWSYQNNNWLQTESLDNGATATYTYNALGQVTRLLNQIGSTTISDFSSIAYDGIGNRTSVTASVPGATSLSGTTGYSYDSKDQLTQETSTRNAGFTNNFGYDSAGNPTTFKGVTKSYNSNNQHSGTGFVYDDNGNPTTYGGTTLAFDPENRMTAYGTALTAGYTGDGLRAWKENSTSRTYFLYDDNFPVIEMNSSGTVTATNSFGTSGLVSRREGSTTVFYSFDSEGNVAQRSNASSSVTSNHLFEAHGGVVSGSSADPFGYKAQAGYYTDSETGLQLLTHRYYDPSTGRFLTRDPISYEGGINLYGYVTNNPVAFADPSGLKPGSKWYDTWERWADIRRSKRFWDCFKKQSIKNGDWLSATAADIANGLISLGRLPDIQEDGEILGSDSSAGEKIRAGGDLISIGAGWYFGITGKEIVPRDPKSFRIAPLGNRNWRRGWQSPHLNELPHYHRRIVGPNGQTVPGGSVNWHRPWQKGF